MKNRNKKWKYIRNHYFLYLCLIPGVLYYLTFCYVPMGGLIIAFKDYNIFQGIVESPWAGFKYFRQLFKLPNFYSVVRNTLMLNLLSLIIGFPIPIILSLMLNEVKGKVFKKVSQSLLYIPHFMSWIVLASIIKNLLATGTGIVNQLITLLGGEEIFFLGNTTWWVIIYIIAGIWQSMGWGTIIYMAALTGIDQSLYEAAMIDGAGRLQRIIHITIPGIAPTIIIMFIMRMGKLLSIGFEQPMALYNPLVSEVAEVISTYTYTIGIERGQYSLTTAFGFLQSVINLIMIVTSNKITKLFGGEGLY